MEKIIRNKYVLLVGSIIIMSVIYFVVENLIDNYNMKSNDDIIEINESSDVNLSEDVKADIINMSDENSSISEVNDIDDNITEDLEDSIEDGNSIVENKKETFNKIHIYVTGEVNNPGVVILNEGSRIIDAINSAGGATDKADMEKINLVYILEDGMKVNIPSESDLKNNEKFEYIVVGSGEGDDIEVTNSSSSSEGSSSSENSNSGSSGSNASKGFNKYSVVNINTASQTELETLPGIGPSLALKIIEYRKQNGKFSSIGDIKNVSGIGDNKFEKIKSYIKV